MNTVGSRRGRNQWSDDMLQAPENSPAAVSVSSSLGALLATFTPWTHFKNTTAFLLGPAFSSLITVKDLEGTDLLKDKSH